MITCRNCMHWDTDNDPTPDDFYGNCSVLLGDKVEIVFCESWEGCDVSWIETESSFYCAAAEKEQ